MATGGGLIGALRVTLGLDTAQFEAGTKRARAVAQRDVSEIQKTMAGIRTSMNGLIAGATVTALVGATKRALDFAGSLGEVAQQLGVTTRELQEYRYAGSQVGISQEEMDKSLAKLTKTMGEALAGSKQQVGVFKELGPAVESAVAAGRSAGQVIPLISDALAKVKDPAERARIETELFGKAGQKLDTLLAGGSGAIDELRNAAARLGLVLSDEQIRHADDTADRLDALKQVLEARIAGVVADNADAILGLANALATLVGQAAQASRELPGLLKILGFGAAGGILTKSPAGAVGGGLIGLVTEMYDRVKNDPYGIRRMGKSELVSETRKTAAFLRGIEQAGQRGNGDWKSSFAYLQALDKEMGQRMAASAKPQGAGGAPTPEVPAGVLTASGGAHHARRGPKDRTEQLTERFQHELAGLQDDEWQAQAELTNDITMRATIAERRLDMEQKAYDEDVDSRVRQGELTAAQAAELKAQKQKNIDTQRTVIEYQKADDLAREANDVAEAQLETQDDILQGELAAARTQAERRTIQLQILENEKKIEKAKLEEIVASNLASEADKRKAQDRLDHLDEAYGQKSAAINRDTMGPLAAYFDSVPKTFAEINEAAEKAAAEGVHDLSSGLADAVVHGKSLGDVLKNSLESFQQKLLELALDRTFQWLAGGGQGGVSGLLGSLGGLFGIGGGAGGSSGGWGDAGGLGSIFGAVGGAFLPRDGGIGGSPLPGSASSIFSFGNIFAGLPGLADGGSFMAGGIPGIDRNVLAVNGIPKAWVGAHERIDVSNPANDRGSAGNTVVQLVVGEGQMFEPRVEGISGDVTVRTVSAGARAQARTSRHNLGGGASGR